MTGSKVKSSPQTLSPRRIGLTRYHMTLQWLVSHRILPYTSLVPNQNYFTYNNIFKSKILHYGLPVLLPLNGLHPNLHPNQIHLRMKSFTSHPPNYQKVHQNNPIPYFQRLLHLSLGV